jgi:hypothetical protein
MKLADVNCAKSSVSPASTLRMFAIARSLRACYNSASSTIRWSLDQLQSSALRRKLIADNTSIPRVNMSNTRNQIPLLPRSRRHGSARRWRPPFVGPIGHGKLDRSAPDLPRAHAVIAWPDFRQAAGGNRFLSSSFTTRLPFDQRRVLRRIPAFAGEGEWIMRALQRMFGRSFQGLWRNPEFVKLWTSLTITSFGAQVTNLALPLAAAVMLQATPWQMGVLVALETVPFALVSLHAAC